MSNINESLPSWTSSQWAAAEQKMADAETGKRAENWTRCGNEKIEAYYDISIKRNYVNNIKNIESELHRRGMDNVIQQYASKKQGAQQAQPTQKATQNLIVFKDSEFTEERASWVYIDKNNPDQLIKNLLVHTGSIRLVFICLVYAMLGNLQAVSDALKDFLIVHCGYDIDTVMAQVNNMINDPVLFKAIKLTFVRAKAKYDTKKESLEEAEHLKEKVEKHDTLNPKLFDGTVLKDEVREKILEIVNKFVEDLEKDGIRIVIKDIVLIGSNVSYNYTDQSDLDIHIIADTASLHCPDNLYPLIYSAYRSVFNKKFDIDFYGIPVELFVEAGDVPTVSNGIYSVKENEWVKEPVLNDIPEYDVTALQASVNDWSAKAANIMSDISSGFLEGKAAHDAIIDYVEKLYELRKTGLQKTGEYGTENLTFKEIRNAGILDELKDLKNAITSKQLSLEAIQEQLDERKRYEYAQQLSRAAHTQVILQSNGYFFAYNVKESDVDYMVRALSALDFVAYVRRGAAGRYDFSHMYPGALPTRCYTVEGKIKE